MSWFFYTRKNKTHEKLDKVLSILSRMERRMSNLETELDAGLADLGTNLSDLGVKVDEVIAALESKPNVDLSDEIALLSSLSADVKDTAGKLDSALNPPTTEPPVDTAPVDTGDSTDGSTAPIVDAVAEGRLSS